MIHLEELRRRKKEREEEKKRRRENREIEKNIATCYESMPGTEAGMDLY